MRFAFQFKSSGGFMFKKLQSVLFIFLLIQSTSLIAAGISEKDLEDAQKILLYESSGDFNKANLILKELMIRLSDQVKLETEQEAESLNMTLNNYLESEKSFDAFLNQLKQVNTDELDQEPFVLLLLKSGIRFQAQVNVSFPSKKYFTQLQEAEEVLAKLQTEFELKISSSVDEGK